ncbi:MAG: hypothetical protein ACLUSP_06220 [Christensenellales bacterium]
MQTLTMTKIWDGNVTGSDRYLTLRASSRRATAKPFFTLRATAFLLVG